MHSKCTRPSWTEPSNDRLERVHSAEYIESVKVFAEQGGGYVDGDTVMCPQSYRVARMAVIGRINLDRLRNDIMVPMSIPSFGGMLIAIMTMFVVPVLYCSVQEWKLRLGIRDPRFAAHDSAN